MFQSSFNINNVYLDSLSVIVSKKEKEGPLGKYFANYIDDYLFGCETFEKAQSKLAKTAIYKAIKKSIYNIDDIQLAIAGDLSNQIFSSTSAAKEEMFPFIGIYGACSSGILAMILASVFIESNIFSNALTFTSSHVCVSQRQLRYPIEYASISKDSSTTTVTGACAIILSKKKNIIKVTKATLGKIIDILSTNVNDMGTCMAYAAIDTFLCHLKNNNETINDYDLVVTGDLSLYGKNIFIDELKEKGIDLSDKYIDCGDKIYDSNKQDVNAGGSGPACVMCVTFSYIINKMLKGIYKKVLVIATGALHSQISFQQKETIPCIAHAIVLESNL